MTSQPTRKLTLIDAMILVAAAAVAFAGVRAEQTRHLHPSTHYVERPFELGGADPFAVDVIHFTTSSSYVSYSIAGPISGLGGYSAWFSKVWAWAESAQLAAPCLAALSLAMLLIRLRRPRPPWPRLVGQAGLVASLGASVALGIRLGRALLKLLFEYYHPTMSMPSTGPAPSRLSWIACQTTQPHLIGAVVLASWVVLLVGGRRRREPGWIDRGGIAVGLGWVVLLLNDLFRSEPA